MGPGHGLAKRNHQQQTGKPHRMPTSACTSPGKAEKGTGRPLPRKKTGGGGTRTAHSHHIAQQHHKRRPNPPPRRHRRQEPRKGRREITQPKPATPSRGQRPTGRRDTRNTRTHTTLGRVAVHCPVEMLSSIDTSTKRNSFTIIDKPCPNIQGSFQDSTKISIPAIYCTISPLITIASDLQDSLSYLHVRARARCVLGCYTPLLRHMKGAPEP